MDKIIKNQALIRTLKKRPSRQHKYRQAQESKGLVRFELQLPSHIKKQFDQLVEKVADEYEEPWDKRQRVSQARTQLFEELTTDIRHEFSQLNQEIAHLKEEIKALSPTFFKTEKAEQTPIPEAIKSLPDDSTQLKQLLTKLYQELQTAKQAGLHYKRQATQFETLYEASSRYNEELQLKIKHYENDALIKDE